MCLGQTQGNFKSNMILIKKSYLKFILLTLISAKRQSSSTRHVSLVSQMGKNLLALQGTWVRSLGWVQSLGQKDPLGKGMATHSSILAWRTPWTEEPGGLPCGCKELDAAERLTFSLSRHRFSTMFFSDTVHHNVERSPLC